MAVTDTVGLRAMGERPTTLVAGEPALEKLLVSTNGDQVEFWLLTAATDAATELRLYEASLALYDWFPDLGFRVHVLNPDYFENGDVRSLVPADAQAVPLPGR